MEVKKLRAVPLTPSTVHHNPRLAVLTTKTDMRVRDILRDFWSKAWIRRPSHEGKTEKRRILRSLYYHDFMVKIFEML